MLAVLCRKLSPNRITLSVSRGSFSGETSWNKCGVLREVSTFKIASGLSIFLRWSFDNGVGIEKGYCSKGWCHQSRFL